MYDPPMAFKKYILNVTSPSLSVCIYYLTFFQLHLIPQFSPLCFSYHLSPGVPLSSVPPITFYFLDLCNYSRYMFISGDLKQATTDEREHVVLFQRLSYFIQCTAFYLFYFFKIFLFFFCTAF